MNSFAQNINYIAGLDNTYGSKVELYKNNLSLKNVEHDIELKFSYYNNDDKKIHSIIHSEPGVLVGGINDVLLAFKSTIESSISGSEFTCTVSSGVQNFVVNNVVMISIAIDSNNDTYKAYELEAKVITAGVVTYDVFGEVGDVLKILPSLAMITSSDINAMANVYEIQDEVITVSDNITSVRTVSDSIENVNITVANITNINIVSSSIANVNTVATNITELNYIVSNMAEILSADENAAIATAKASEASDSAASALVFKNAASVSADNSLISANNADASEANALNSASAAAVKANEALVSANAAITQAEIATVKAFEASESATNALISENGALSSKNSAAISASTATTKAAEAAASSSNASSSASIAGASASEASSSASAALLYKNSANASEINAGLSETNAFSYKNSAYASATDAADSYNLATIKASDASASASIATTKAYEATISASSSAVSASVATTKANDASLSAASASASINKAEKWATENEDIEVEVGEYSAKHWAMKAQGFAKGNAINIGYDNTSSGLVSTNVQDAIDEIDGDLDALVSNVYTKTEVNTALALKVSNSEKGTANGVATLDTNGKVVLTQIPDSVLGQLEYMGTLDFTTMPIATQKGQYWIASVSGNGYLVGDWAVWNGSSFDKVDNTDAVASVAGRTGAVVLTKADVGLASVDNTADNTKNVLSAIKWTTARTITLSGDVAGSASVDGSDNVTITTTVQPNSVALGTDTTGNYVAGATAGTGISITGTAGEGWSPVITNTAPNVTTDISITPSTTSVTVNSSDGTDGIISSATTIAAGVMSASDKIKLDGIATGATANTGTVTSIATSGAITGGTITTTGTISHSTADGYLHVPATGTTNNGNVLTAGATAGSLSWATLPSAPVTSVAGKTGVVTLVKADVGLANVDNTSDANKPVSTATQTALNLKANLASPTFTGTPIAPTATVGTNTTQIATTEFVLANTSAVNATTVGNATAGIATGGIGSYAFALYTNAANSGTYTIAPGATVAGSKLYYCDTTGYYNEGNITNVSSLINVGTWKCMGAAIDKQITSVDEYNPTLWLRIA